MFYAKASKLFQNILQAHILRRTIDLDTEDLCQLPGIGHDHAGYDQDPGGPAVMQPFIKPRCALQGIHILLAHQRFYLSDYLIVLPFLMIRSSSNWSGQPKTTPASSYSIDPEDQPPVPYAVCFQFVQHALDSSFEKSADIFSKL